MENRSSNDVTAGEEKSAFDLLLYTSSDCGPCKMMERVLDKAKEEIPFTMHVISVDAGNVTQVPAVPCVSFQRSKERVVGLLGLDDLKQMLYRNMCTT